MVRSITLLFGPQTVEDPSPLPFDCPRGRQILKRYPMLESFRHFRVQQPDNLLVCRHLSLDCVHFAITPRFTRRLNSFRGSLTLTNSDDSLVEVVSALTQSTVHLDVVTLKFPRCKNWLTFLATFWFGIHGMDQRLSSPAEHFINLILALYEMSILISTVMIWRSLS